MNILHWLSQYNDNSTEILRAGAAYVKTGAAGRDVMNRLQYSKFYAIESVDMENNTITLVGEDNYKDPFYVVLCITDILNIL